MKKLLISLFTAVVVIFAFAGTALATANFFNGFEENTDGWNGNITRVASGAVPSSTGAYHAIVGQGVYTWWGGQENTFPTNGYVTKLDIYLDMTVNSIAGTDKRIDFSSAIYKPDGNHRRDFVFSIGTNPATTGQFIMNVSNNTPGWPSNPGRDNFILSQTGWYTFRYTFQNNGSGVLEVVMDVLDHSGVLLHSWTLSDPTDIIGDTVGGNGYGWFVTDAVGPLAIDNTEKYNIVPVVGPPINKDQCKKGGWMDFNNPTFKNQGDCVSYIQANENAKKH